MKYTRIDASKWPTAHMFANTSFPEDEIKNYGLFENPDFNEAQKEVMARIIAKRIDDLYDELENRFIKNDGAYEYLENQVQAYMVTLLASVAKDFGLLTDSMED